MSFHGSPKLKAEIESWRQEGLVSDEQAEVLRLRYALDEPPPFYRRSGFALQAVAMTLAAAGAILVISYNFSSLPVFVQMMTGLLPLLAAYGCAAYFTFARPDQSYAELSMFLGSLLLGANIGLQAQIFHFAGYAPDGLKWWLVGALPVAVYYRSAPLSMFLQALFVVWLSLQNQYAHFDWLGIAFLAGFLYVQYRRPNPYALLFLIVSGYSLALNLSIALYDSYRYDLLANAFTVLQHLTAYAALFYAAFRFQEGQYADAIQNSVSRLAFTAVSLALFWFTFEEAFPHTGAARFYPDPVGYAMLAAALVLALLKARRSVEALFESALLLAATAAVALSGWLASANLKDDGAFSDWFAALTPVYMILFFLYCLGRIFYGIQHKSKPHFIGGIFYLLLLGAGQFLALYFDDYLLTALMFFVSAGVILALNRVWNNRYAR